MKRKSFLGLALVPAAASVLTACGDGGGGSTGSSGSTTLRVILANHVWTEAIKAAIPDFEKSSGLKIELTTLGEDQLSDQYNVKLNAGTADLDVMMYRPLQEGKLFAKNGWMADLTAKTKADSAYNWADFQPGPVAATTYKEKVVGVPIITEREVLYYRKDLLQKSGFSAPPKTLDELKAQAAKIAADNPGIAGFVARTGKSPAVTQFSSFLYSYGADWTTKDGKSGLDDPKAVEAYKMYGGLIKDYGPKNVSTDMSWPQAMAIFQQGQAAFYTEADSLYKNATDPTKSKVSDTVGFAQFPAGPAGSKPYNIPSWALGVNKASTNQDNAWKFIAWATSKAMTLKIQQAGVPSARNSVWSDPEGIKGYPKDIVDATLASAKVGVDHDRPVVVKVAQAREIVGAPIVDAITGKDVAASVADAHKKFDAFLADEK
jgi:multiple sugar transport system substrate-binding protein